MFDWIRLVECHSLSQRDLGTEFTAVRFCFAQNKKLIKRSSPTFYTKYRDETLSKIDVWIKSEFISKICKIVPEYYSMIWGDVVGIDKTVNFDFFFIFLLTLQKGDGDVQTE